MQRKAITWKTVGMSQDLSESAFDPKFSYENFNLSLTASDKNSLLSWVNERGTKRIEKEVFTAISNSSLKDVIWGHPVGNAVVDNKIVVFTHADTAIHLNLKEEEVQRWLDGQIAEHSKKLEKLQTVLDGIISDVKKGDFTPPYPREGNEGNKEPKWKGMVYDYTDREALDDDIKIADKNLTDATDKSIPVKRYSNWYMVIDTSEYKNLKVAIDNWNNNGEYVTPIGQRYMIPELPTNLPEYLGTEDNATLMDRLLNILKSTQWFIEGDLQNYLTEDFPTSGLDIYAGDPMAIDTKLIYLITQIEKAIKILDDTESEISKAQSWKDFLEEVRKVLESMEEKIAHEEEEIYYYEHYPRDEDANFSHDFIYLLSSTDSWETAVVKLLYSGNLNFSFDHPLETLSWYETEELQKVYWVDGVNQLRMINVAATAEEISKYSNTYFDALPRLKLEETVTVEKGFDSGSFPAGVMQYAFTYYNQGMQETNIFHVSSLRYISPKIGGAAPDTKVTVYFKIVVNNPDTNFDMLRVYSIIRTSINGTPTCRRVADLKVPDSGSITYTDYGTAGNTIDPTELLFKEKGRYSFGTMDISNNRLFLGDIKYLDNNLLTKELISRVQRECKHFSQDTKPVPYTEASFEKYYYHSQLNGMPCCRFKSNNFYRLGVQFQSDTGAWSEPIFLQDQRIKKIPYRQRSDSTKLHAPIIKNTIPLSLGKDLIRMGYKKVRGLVVFPFPENRRVICQGYITPTVNCNGLIIPDWFFRFPGALGVAQVSTGYSANYFNGGIQELAGDARNLVTPNTSYFHLYTPELEDENLFHPDLNALKCYFEKVTNINARRTWTAWGIAWDSAAPNASTPDKIELSLNGPVYSFNSYYVDDYKDDNDQIAYNPYYRPGTFYIYPWQQNGSAVNDVWRDGMVGVIRQKWMSNLRIAEPDLPATPPSTDDEGHNSYYCTAYTSYVNSNPITVIDSDIIRCSVDTAIGTHMTYITDSNDPIGDYNGGLREADRTILMNYTTSNSIVLQVNRANHPYFAGNILVDLINSGAGHFEQGDSALMEAVWLPCGESVPIRSDADTVYEYTYGDSYYQRYDCLKTCAGNTSTMNQNVEIGSFMVETYLNIDGRYDNNKMKSDNRYVNRTNFNLINNVYTQQDNYFNYKITYLQEDFNEKKENPYSFTMTQPKTSGEEIDVFSNITVANVFDAAGVCGSIKKIVNYNDTLFGFQDNGIFNIQYNENVQIASTTGVPIEIASSEKVRGIKYLSTEIGCANKWSIQNTSEGVYFIDSDSKKIYLLNDKLEDISSKGGMYRWCKEHVPPFERGKNPFSYNDFFSVQDTKEDMLYFINNDYALGYSRRLSAFTSFYSYENLSYLSNTVFGSVWFQPSWDEETPVTEIWKHHGGDYCKFFDVSKPYYMTLIGNQDPNTDKTFTNLEYRASVQGEVAIDSTTQKPIPLLPFDTLEVWNEYQHGVTNLSDRTGRDRFNHDNTGNNLHLQRKFRMWRNDIPRDNAPIEMDNPIKTKRVSPHPLDRIRNPWAYIKLQKESGTDKRVEVHDIAAYYY